MFDRQSAFGFACDLGTDRIMAYAFDKDAAEPLSPAPNPWYSSNPGAGPRHGVFSPAGSTAYYLNELDSTVDVLSYDPAAGGFTRRQSLSTLPAGTKVQSIAAAIRTDPRGKFVYASNRGHDSIALFKVKPPSGELEFVDALPSGGKNPRDFNLDPAGNFLLAAHQDTDNAVIFQVDQTTGLLRKEREYTVPSAVCVIFAGP
jgi:6-phosphogluconolactonase